MAQPPNRRHRPRKNVGWTDLDAQRRRCRLHAVHAVAVHARGVRMGRTVTSHCAASDRPADGRRDSPAGVPREPPCLFSARPGRASQPHPAEHQALAGDNAGPMRSRRPPRRFGRVPRYGNPAGPIVFRRGPCIIHQVAGLRIPANVRHKPPTLGEYAAGLAGADPPGAQTVETQEVRESS
jgi:hypothetical protein